MKQVKVRFQRNPNIDHIDVLIQAKERDASVTRLMEQLSGQPPEALTITDVDGKLLSVFTDDIVSLSVRGKLTLLMTEDGRYLIRQPLQSLEAQLDPERFLRISRHELINVDKILRCDLSISRELKLELSGGYEAWASRRCIPAVLACLTPKKEG